MSQPTIHLIANAHLDPVWLWDWREGLNEGIVTVRTILDLMDAYPDLTFIRGEAAVYQHIEWHDPETFARIQQYVEAGRWDVVGGTYIQPDTNLPATEVFARHFARAQHYFQQKFGRRARIAWAADSFGHSGGLPEILAAAGMEGFAFTRPSAGQVSLEKPAFWWEGVGGSRILAYRPPVGWYGCERDELIRKLDATREVALNGGLENVGCFYGVGNHGGGPTRRHLEEIAVWAEQRPEVNVVHSGLHRLFDALREEAAAKGENLFPVHHGELNFCLRGCYASVAKFKFAYRKAEAAVMQAERTTSAIGAALKTPMPDLGETWDAVLFNSFHDILPGSSVERAFDDQLAWAGGAIHQSQRAELTALNALARRVDTTLTPPQGDHPTPATLLVWNPHPHPYRGHIEFEACLDYRPIGAYNHRADELPVEVRNPEGKAAPFQSVRTEHNFGTEIPWRKRVVVPAELPPLGWSVYTLGWVEGAEAVASDTPAVTAPEPGTIENEFYTVRALAGASGVQVLRQGQSLFGESGLSAITVEDPWGSWGGMGEEPDAIDLSTVRTTWTIERVETLESGPERATLWVRFVGGASRLDLTFSLYRQREAVDVSARVFWNERAARLKLVMPVGERAEFDVPGGSVRRGPTGEVPGGRWVRVENENGAFGFASDALTNFDCKDGALRATVVRSTHYSANGRTDADVDVWRPVVDAGELRFRFLLTSGGEELPVLARELEEPPVALLVSPKSGDLPRSGSLAELSPTSTRVLALKPAEDGNGWILRVQETAGRATQPQFTWLGQEVALSVVEPDRIATWRLVQEGTQWQALPTRITE